MSAAASPASVVIGEPVEVRAQPPGEEVPRTHSPGRHPGGDSDGDRVGDAPVKASKKAVVKTDSLDGLRALATMHVVLGHFSLYTDWTGKTGNRLLDGFDLMGGTSIGLFYLISGFVLMIGYGSADEAPAHCSRWCACCDRCFSCFCVGPEKRRPSVDPVASEDPVASQAVDICDFYWKRVARLAPLWYLGNILALPLYFGGYAYVLMRRAEEFWTGLALALVPPLGAWFQFFPPAGHLWTISTLMNFYIFFPALYPRIRRVRPESLRSFAMVLYGIQIVVVLLGFMGVYLLTGIDWDTGTLREDQSFAFARAYWFSRWWPLNRLPIFVMGLCAGRQSQLEALSPAISQTCRCSCRIGKGLKAWMLVAFISLVCGLGIAEQLTGGQGFSSRFFAEMLLPAAFYELLLAVARPATDPGSPSCLHAFLGSPPLRFLADISLSVYVVHDTMCRSLALVLRGPVERSLEMPEGWRMPVWGPAAILPLSLVVGWAATRFFEKPMQTIILKRALRKQ